MIQGSAKTYLLAAEDPKSSFRFAQHNSDGRHEGQFVTECGAPSVAATTWMLLDPTCEIFWWHLTFPPLRDGAVLTLKVAGEVRRQCYLNKKQKRAQGRLTIRFKDINVTSVPDGDTREDDGTGPPPFLSITVHRAERGEDFEDDDDFDDFDDNEEESITVGEGSRKLGYLTAVRRDASGDATKRRRLEGVFFYGIGRAWLSWKICATTLAHLLHRKGRTRHAALQALARAQVVLPAALHRELQQRTDFFAAHCSVDHAFNLDEEEDEDEDEDEEGENNDLSLERSTTDLKKLEDTVDEECIENDDKTNSRRKKSKKKSKKSKRSRRHIVLEERVMLIDSDKEQEWKMYSDDDEEDQPPPQQVPDEDEEGENNDLSLERSTTEQKNHEGESFNQEEDCSLEHLQEQRQFDLNVKEILPIVIGLREAISCRDFEESMEFMNKISHEIQNMSYHFVVHFEVGHLISSRIKDTFSNRKNIIKLSRKMKNECKRMLAKKRKVLPKGFMPIVKEGITDKSLEDEVGENNDGILERSTTMQAETRSRPPRPPPPVRRISSQLPSQSLACRALERRSADETDALRREDKENEEDKEEEEDEAEEKTEVEEENDVEEEDEDEYREKLDWVRGTHPEIHKVAQSRINEEESEVQEEHDLEEEDEDEDKNEEVVEDKKESKNEKDSEDEKEQEEESDGEEEDGGREEDREKEEDGDAEEDSGAASRGAGTEVPRRTASAAPTPTRAPPRAPVAPAAAPPAPPASHIAGLDAWMQGIDPAAHRAARAWFHEQRLCSVGALAELGDDGTEMIVEALGVRGMLVEKLLRRRLTRLSDV